MNQLRTERCWTTKVSFNWEVVCLIIGVWCALIRVGGGVR